MRLIFGRIRTRIRRCGEFCLVPSAVWMGLVLEDGLVGEGIGEGEEPEGAQRGGIQVVGTDRWRWFLKANTADPRLNTLRGLVGKIPSNPLWAEMLARKQQEARERAAIVDWLRSGGRGRCAA